MSEQYDVVIAGHGVQGLICASLLSQQGLKVAAFPVSSPIEGAGAYDEFVEGFKTGPCAHMPVPVDLGIADKLDLENLGWSMNNEATASFAPVGINKGDYLFLTSGRQATSREITKFSEADAAEFIKLHDQLKIIASLMDQVAGHIPPYDEKGWRDIWSVFETGRFLSTQPEEIQQLFADLMNQSLAQFLSSRFESDEVTGFLAFQSVIGTMTPATAKNSAASLLQYILCLGETTPYKGDWQSLRGSMHSLLSSMKRAAGQTEAFIDHTASIKNISFNGQRADGVILSNGEKVDAKLVICDVNPFILFDHMIGLDGLSHDFKHKLDSLRSSGGFVRLKVALKELPKFSSLSGSGDESFLKGEIVFCPTLEHLTTAQTETRKEGGPQYPALSMIIPSAAEEGLAPNGKHVASILSQPFDSTLIDDAINRKNIISVTLAMIDDYAPGFTDLIEGEPAIFSGQNCDLCLPPMNRMSLRSGLPLNQVYASRFGHHALGFDLPFENMLICGYGPEASATPHVNQGGENAAKLALDILNNA